ncbi:MAG TPA: ABC transporter ATP-binding protein [Alcanivorax sp.]|nr:ABC transporter ATP-binding protein [Alcanivorax sp.]
MIRLDSLTRRYGDFVAVENLSCTIESGEIIGLLGRNGAGKTTTMKMLTGALEPDSGSIQVDGLDMRNHRRAIQRRIGYLPENCPVYPEMTVVEYLHHRATMLEVSQQDRLGAIRRTVEQAELQNKLLTPIGTLSRGFRQRVGVAQAILHDPDIVILDEPTNGLDPKQIHQMRDLIRELSRHATVIVSTHILQEVEAVCRRVLMLRNGALALDSPLDELSDKGRLRVDTDIEPGRAQALLENIDGVVTVTGLGGGALEVRLSAPADQVAPQVARAVLDAGHRLYRLEPRTFGLETLFRESNDESKEAAHG